MSRTVSDIMEGIQFVTKKKVGNNTVRYTTENGETRYRLHDTDVIIIDKSGTVTLSSGGWRTPTTKDRINSFQNLVGVYQEKGIWYMSTPDDIYGLYSDKKDRIPFYDGIRIKNDGSIIGIRKALKEKEKQLRLLKLINDYCKAVKELETIPEPSGGDCWLCRMIPSNDNVHLINHLREKYIHGTLILKALEHANYISPWLIVQMGLRDSIVRAVRRYFKSKLGIAS